MRASQLCLLLAVVSLGGCTEGKNDLQDPSKKFQATSAYGSMQQIKGDLLGSRADPITGMPAPAGVPYTERVFDVGVDAELWPSEPTTLGTDVGLLAGFHMGYVSAGDVDGMPPPDQFLPVQGGLDLGTGLAVVRRPGLLIAVHSSLKLQYVAARLGDIGTSPVVVYGGVRVHYESGGLRTRLEYDFMPFWSSESRLEHRLTALLSSRPKGGWGYGVRAGLEVGQRRLAEGGLNDVSFTIGMEVQR